MHGVKDDDAASPKGRKDWQTSCNISYDFNSVLPTTSYDFLRLFNKEVSIYVTLGAKLGYRLSIIIFFFVFILIISNDLCFQIRITWSSQALN